MTEDEKLLHQAATAYLCLNFDIWLKHKRIPTDEESREYFEDALRKVSEAKLKAIHEYMREHPDWPCERSPVCQENFGFGVQRQVVEHKMKEMREMKKNQDETFKIACAAMSGIASTILHGLHTSEHQKFLRNYLDRLRNDIILTYGDRFWEDVIALPDDMRLNLGFRYFDSITRDERRMMCPIWFFLLLPAEFIKSKYGYDKSEESVFDEMRMGCVATFVV